MAEKLKPCPFCGCKAVEMYGANSAWAVCVGCCATGPRRFIHEYSVRERSVRAAIEAWNNRPDIRRETIEKLLRDVITFDRIRRDWEARGNDTPMSDNQITGALLVLRKATRAIAEESCE